MTPLQLMRSLLESKYDYATTDIAPPSEVADFLLDWNQLNVPDEVLHVAEDGGKGREREPHITVKYGLLASEVPPELRALAKATAPFPIFMGKVSLFTTNPEYDVLKLDVESPWLRRLNRQISDSVPHEDTYPTYQPHLTLAYVEKGTCDHMDGDDPFAAGELPREFTAYGFRFAGAGEDEDEARKVEMLLFSRTKKLDNFTEARVRVPSNYDHYQQARQTRQEITAQAASLVEAWRRKALTTEQMLRRLHTGDWVCGHKYWVNRRQFPKAFGSFVEQVTEYVEQLRESAFAEASAITELDPFANCNFPVDPDRIKNFLRRGKANTRTVL